MKKGVFDMKDRKPVGAFLGSMFIVGVQAIVYILVYNEAYYSVLDGS